MSRIQVGRGVIPRLYDDSRVLEIQHNPLGSLSFDPHIDTRISTTIFWKTEVGTTVTTGTSHDFSYTPTAGPKTCQITVLAGLSEVSALDIGSDAVVSVNGLKKLTNATSFVANSNSSIQLDMKDLPPNLTTISLGSVFSLTGRIDDFPRSLTRAYLTNCINLSGTINNLPSGMTLFRLTYAPNVTGSISNLPSLLTDCQLAGCTGLSGSINIMPTGLTILSVNSALVTGSIDNLPNGLRTCDLAGCSQLTGTNVSHMAAIDFVYLQDQSANVARVNGIVDNVYAAKATMHTAVTMDLGGNNATMDATQAAEVVTLEAAPYNWIITD